MEMSRLTIELLFFGATADVVGSRQTHVEIAENDSLASLLKSVNSMYPGLSSHTLLTAVNEEYADLDRCLSAGDRVAIFTPVSGG